MGFNRVSNQNISSWVLGIKLTHWDQVTQIFVSKLCHRWFRQWSVASSVTSRCLNQCRDAVWLKNKNEFQRNLNRNTNIFSQENKLASVFCKISAIFHRPQCGLFIDYYTGFNKLRPGQNSRHFPDDIFKCIFLNENVSILIKISPKFVPKGPINNIPALVQIMAWCRPGEKPLSEPMMVKLLTHICVIRHHC